MNFNIDYGRMLKSQWLRKNSIILINTSKVREAFTVNEYETKKQKTDFSSPGKNLNLV